MPVVTRLGFLLLSVLLVGCSLATVSSTPSPSSPPASPTAPPGEPWMTGRELMDVLSQEFGYQWSEVTDGSGATMFWSTNPASTNEHARIEVKPTAGLAAPVAVIASVDDFVEYASPHVDRVTQILAPEALAWIEDAMDQALASEGDFSSTTQTATGGYVSVGRVDEEYLEDWMSVWFSRDPR